MIKEELIGVETQISTALIVAGMMFKENLDRETRNKIKINSKYKLYKYYGEEMEEPATILTKKEKDIINIVVNMVIEYNESNSHKV